MKKYSLLLALFFLALPAVAQLRFLDRQETPAQAFEPVFELIRIPTGLVAFRTFQPRSLDANRVFEYYITNTRLQSQGLVEVKIKPGFDMIGYDTDQDQLYVLFAKGETAAAEKYVLHLDLSTQVGIDYLADNLLPMDLVEFLVLNKRAIFMGNADARPVVQILSLVDKSVQTVPGIYGNDSQVVQIIKIPDLEALEVVIRRKGPLKTQETAVLTVDLEGNLLRELKMEAVGAPGEGILDGLLLAGDGYAQTLVGSYGKEFRNDYAGMYLSQINEFGEQSTGLYTLADFPNFYNYLPEKQKIKQQEQLASELEKGKLPSIRNTFVVRDVKELEDSYLLYFDQYSASSTRGSGRVVPPSASQRYRYDQGSRMGYIPYYMDPFNSLNAQAFTVVTEYNYRAAHFMEIAKTGQVLWDNAARYDNVVTNYSEPFAEISLQGDELFHLYLVNDQINLTYFNKGEKLLENQFFALELAEGQGEIQNTDLESLRLLHWYGPYFLLSGLQKVRFTDAQEKELVKEVFFIQKILVNGNLYTPKEGQD